MKGETTHRTKNVTRLRESFCRPAYSTKATENTAPAGTAIRAARRNQRGKPRSTGSSVGRSEVVPNPGLNRLIAPVFPFTLYHKVNGVSNGARRGWLIRRR